jgi:hypothetical protein
VLQTSGSQSAVARGPRPKMLQPVLFSWAGVNFLEKIIDFRFWGRKFP